MSFLDGYARKLGVLEYLGTWDASTNTPALISSVGNKGGYYIVSISGTTNLDNISDWQPGDWVIFNGTSWQKIDTTDQVLSVSNRSGHVVLTKNDVDLANVPNVDATDRSNHTGTQLAVTISDFIEATQDAVGLSLTNTADINLTYLDNLNQVTADLTNTGVVAGIYTTITVDSKGRVTSGSNPGGIIRYAYKTTTTATNTNATYTTVSELTTASLPIGLYFFKFLGLMQSGATQNGVGVRISNGTSTISTCNAKWSIAQGTNGAINQNFEYDQLATTTNITSASVQAANTTFNVTGFGVFRVTTAGTVVIQIRSEVNANSASLLADSSFIVELV